LLNNLKNNKNYLFIYLIKINNNQLIYNKMGIGDWGLGIGDWG